MTWALEGSATTGRGGVGSVVCRVTVRWWLLRVEKSAGESMTNVD